MVPRAGVSTFTAKSFGGVGGSAKAAASIEAWVVVFIDKAGDHGARARLRRRLP